MKHIWIFSALVLGANLLVACSQEPENHMILFGEQEEGVDPYQTRIIVTPKYLRFDEGDNSDSYLLFDRKNRTAYNVNHNMQTTMILKYKDEKIESPMKLTHSVEIIDDLKDAPDVNSIRPVHRQLKTNDQVCLDIVTVDGLMPGAVAALKEFQLLLASDSVVTFNTIPADLHQPCALAMNTFAPIRHLEYGFPVQEWKPGYSRSLIDYKEDFKTKPEFFSVPANYFTYTVQEFREGRVDIQNQKVIRDEISPGSENESPGLTPDVTSEGKT